MYECGCLELTDCEVIGTRSVETPAVHARADPLPLPPPLPPGEGATAATITAGGAPQVCRLVLVRCRIHGNAGPGLLVEGPVDLKVQASPIEGSLGTVEIGTGITPVPSTSSKKKGDDEPSKEIQRGVK